MTDEITGATPPPAPQGDTGAPSAVQGSTDPQPTGAQPGTNPADSAAPPAKPKRDGGFQRRINELTREREELRRTNERLLALAERQTSQAPKEAGPKPEQFATLQEYFDAVVDHKLKQAQTQSQEKPTGQPSQEQAVRAAELRGRIDDLRAEMSERYDAEEISALFEDDDFPIHPVTRDFLLESEKGAELGYYLVANQKEARRIARLSPLQQARELTRLEDRLTAAPQQQKKPSSAPAPVTPVGGGKTQATEPSESDDMATWMKKRQQQLRGPRR